MKPGNSIIATAPSAIKAEIAVAHMHPAESCGSKEHMSRANIVHDNKIVSDGTELDMYKARTVRCMDWMR
jgi:hypothetical protein